MAVDTGLTGALRRHGDVEATCHGRSRPRATPARPGSPSCQQSAGPVVQLLDRQRASTSHDKYLDRERRDPARLHQGLHRQAPEGRRHQPPDGGASPPSATASSRVRRAARLRRGPRGLRTASSAWPAWCSRTSRTTTSTSSTGAIGSSGARCSSSARSCARRASAPSPRTSSTCKRHEVPDALFDLYHSWAAPAAAAGPSYWPADHRRAARRSSTRSTRVKPTPALSTPPEVDHRALHDHALGHHLRVDRQLARRRRVRGRLAQRHGRLARRRGGPGPRHLRARPDQRGAGGRDPRRPAHRTARGRRSSARSRRRSPTSAA